MTGKQYQVTRIKGKERFVFRFCAGQERVVIDSFTELAGRDNSGFDLFDAAVLSYHMGRLEAQLKIDGTRK